MGEWKKGAYMYVGCWLLCSTSVRCVGAERTVYQTPVCASPDTGLRMATGFSWVGSRTHRLDMLCSSGY